jgi:hypothetical protein
MPLTRFFCFCNLWERFFYSMRNPQNQDTRYSDVISSVVSPEGELIPIHYHLHTGRVVARADARAAGDYHPGILLGTDKYGRYWIAHNHARNKKPVIEPAEAFCKGRRLMFDLRDVKRDAMEVAARAVRQVLKGKAHHELIYDAEDFISLSVGKRHPAPLEKLSEGAVLLGVLSVFLGIIE